jgi:hypothetical protein
MKKVDNMTIRLIATLERRGQRLPVWWCSKCHACVDRTHKHEVKR